MRTSCLDQIGEIAGAGSHAWCSPPGVKSGLPHQHGQASVTYQPVSIGNSGSSGYCLIPAKTAAARSGVIHGAYDLRLSLHLIDDVLVFRWRCHVHR